MWNAWRLRTYPRALLACLLGAVVISILGASGSSTVTGRLGGDLPAFYGAGRILLQGDAAGLYDWAVQSAAQADLHGGAEGEFLAFAYPPFVAVAYVPLAWMPFVLAYTVHTGVLLGLLALSVQGMRTLLPRVDRWPIEAFALAFGFYPVFRSVTGAQNSVLTLALLVGIWAALRRERPAWAGFAAGLLLFKPQFALPALGLLALRHPRSTIGAAASAALLWLAGAAVGGVGWIGWWASQIAQFHAMDQDVNAPNSVGLIGVCEALLGPATPQAVGLGAVLTLAVVVGLVAFWWRRDSPLDLRMGLLACGVLLVPPHAMFYDATLLVLPLAVLANRWGRASFRGLAAISVVGWSAVFAPTLGVNPLFVAVLATATWLIAAARQQ